MKNICDPIKKDIDRWGALPIGGIRRGAATSWRRRLLKSWGLLFSLGGSGTLELDGRSIAVPPGALLVYKPDYPYVFRPQGNWDYLWFHYLINTGLAGELVFDEVLPGLGMRVFGEGTERRRIEDELSEALELEQLRHQGWEDFVQALLEVVLRRFLFRGEHSKRLAHERVRKAARLLIRERPRRIAEIAAECGISEPLLYSLFRREMGCSPRSYREDFFLRRGCSLLLNTDMTVCEIAEACHMCDRYYFSSRFKKRFGISPIRLRKITEARAGQMDLPNGSAPPKK